MEHIQKTLSDLLRRSPLGAAVSGWRAVEIWAETVGSDIAGRSRAIRFEKGVLLVEVTTSSWMQELSFLERRIVKKLNTALGEDAVRRVRFRLAGPPRGGASKGA